MRVRIGAVLVVVAALLWPARDARAGGLGADQEEALRKYFETNAKLRDLGARPLELLKDPRYKDFFGTYGDALQVIKVASELSRANDAEAAKAVLGALADKAIEKLAPDFAKVLGWVGWAKTGMEVFKEFVFDPALEEMNAGAYAHCRDAGQLPEDAFACLRAFGHVRNAALARFRAEYGEQPFQPGSRDQLLPRWERKLAEFANAWFEAQYQARLLAELQQSLARKRSAAEGQLPSLDARLRELVEQQAVARDAESAVPGASGDRGRAPAAGGGAGQARYELYKVTAHTAGASPDVWSYDAESGRATYAAGGNRTEYQWTVPRQITAAGATVSVSARSQAAPQSRMNASLDLRGGVDFSPQAPAAAALAEAGQAANASASATVRPRGEPDEFVITAAVQFALGFDYHYRRSRGDGAAPADPVAAGDFVLVKVVAHTAGASPDTWRYDGDGGTATYDHAGNRARYRWTVPPVIPAAGLAVSVSAESSAVRGARHNATIDLRGGVDFAPQPPAVAALAESGQSAQGAATATLKPRSPDARAFSFAVSIQFALGFEYHYERR